MDTELLKTFLEVKKTRHFGKAAENLYLTQAAVSSRIKQLESYLGNDLFSRYRNNLQLTSIGERFASHAETILITWEKAQTEALLKNNQKQVVSLATTSGLWTLVLQDVLHKLHNLMPEVILRAESIEQDVITRRLMERNLDFSLIYEPAKVADLISTPVAQTELILVSSEKKISVDEALNHSYVFVDWGTAYSISYSQLFKDSHIPVLYTSQAQIALEFILHHGGTAYLPARLITDLLDQKLFPVADAPIIKRSIYACYHSHNSNSELIQKIIAIINELS